MIRQNTAAIVVSDPAVLHTDLILLAAYPGIIMIITGDSDTNAIIAGSSVVNPFVPYREWEAVGRTFPSTDAVLHLSPRRPA